METIHNKYLRFTIVADVQEHYVTFTVYDILGLNPKDDNHLWHLKDSDCNDTTDTLDNAEVFLHGSVKWDGCSNWHIDNQDRAMIHGCGREDLMRIGEVMAFCWDYTSNNCSKWMY